MDFLRTKSVIAFLLGVKYKVLGIRYEVHVQNL